MSLNFEDLKKAPRILIEAPLKPLAGTRIQPTGFPDLGAAVYDAPDGTPMLLVESAQSMANRLEAVCWDEATEDVVEELKGLPYVKVRLAGLGDGQDHTTSLQEFHRLNSPYIMSGLLGDQPFSGVVSAELKLSGMKSEGGDKEAGDVSGVVNLRRLAQVCFKYDPNSLVHGIFLEKIAGRLRHPRALSSFIEASGVGRADSGGVKFDRVMPSKKNPFGLESGEGYTNVPFHRTEFTAKSITAYFSLDLAQIRGYGLGDDATQLLISLSLWKVRKFLESSMRLRSACELELVDDNGQVTAKRPSTFVLPSTDELTDTVSTLLKKCRKQFADPLVTELTWTGGTKKPPKVDKSAGKKGAKKDEE